jgi:hypothetical protein
MNDEELEIRLRAALRPVAPREKFTLDLIDRVMANGNSASNARDARGRRFWAQPWRLVAGMAASLILALGVQHHIKERSDIERGLEARREVIEALRVTSRKLDLAYDVIKNRSSPAEDRSSGADHAGGTTG